MHSYQQSTGQWRDPEERLLFIGYSGHGDGLNNPAMESVHDIGPIPAGMWVIEKPAFHSPTKGPVVMRMTPVDHDAHGRTAFEIHGDKIGHVGENIASNGCIILPRGVREAIADSPDCDLRVIP